jgi:hypothetical protein
LTQGFGRWSAGWSWFWCRGIGTGRGRLPDLNFGNVWAKVGVKYLDPWRHQRSELLDIERRITDVASLLFEAVRRAEFTQIHPGRHCRFWWSAGTLVTQSMVPNH